MFVVVEALLRLRMSASVNALREDLTYPGGDRSGKEENNCLDLHDGVVGVSESTYLAKFRAVEEDDDGGDVRRVKLFLTRLDEFILTTSISCW